jgi:2-methylcitrate dehydratase PrpD
MKNSVAAGATLAEHLADYSHRFTLEMVPGGVASYASYLLLDLLGAALAGVDHTGAVVVPAILAVAEAFPALPGRQALEAMIVGYEVGRRVLDSAGGYRPHNHLDGFHSTGTCGSFAAAAAAAKAMRLNCDQTLWASWAWPMILNRISP